jgi:hypothetical protein
MELHVRHWLPKLAAGMAVGPVKCGARNVTNVQLSAYGARA